MAYFCLHILLTRVSFQDFKQNLRLRFFEKVPEAELKKIPFCKKEPDGEMNPLVLPSEAISSLQTTAAVLAA